MSALPDAKLRSRSASSGRSHIRCRSPQEFPLHSSWQSSWAVRDPRGIWNLRADGRLASSHNQPECNRCQMNLRSSFPTDREHSKSNWTARHACRDPLQPSSPNQPSAWHPIRHRLLKGHASCNDENPEPLISRRQSDDDRCHECRVGTQCHRVHDRRAEAPKFVDKNQ